MKKYNKALIKNIHGSSKNIPKAIYKDRPISLYELGKINQKFLGGGMSQSFFAIPWFEYYIDANNFEYIIEIGSQKGILSTYLANMAAIKESFIFETYELYPKESWSSRKEGGAGHWFEKIADLSPYINFFKEDSFKKETYEHIKENIAQFKTFIFCDGGNKLRELNMYSSLLKEEDRIAVHDWNTPLYDPEVDESKVKPIMDRNNLIYDEPFRTSALGLKTYIMPFKKR